jgi:hypothetical protein
LSVTVKMSILKGFLLISLSHIRSLFLYIVFFLLFFLSPFLPFFRPSFTPHFYPPLTRFSTQILTLDMPAVCYPGRDTTAVVFPIRRAISDADSWIVIMDACLMPLSLPASWVFWSARHNCVLSRAVWISLCCATCVFPLQTSDTKYAIRDVWTWVLSYIFNSPLLSLTEFFFTDVIK